jgi:hypothetical protein
MEIVYTHNCASYLLVILKYLYMCLAPFVWVATGNRDFRITHQHYLNILQVTYVLKIINGNRLQVTSVVLKIDNRNHVQVHL